MTQPHNKICFKACDKITVDSGLCSCATRFFEKTERSSDYVCIDCGAEYSTEQQKKDFTVRTFHQGTCGVCKKDTSVTHIRAYNYLQRNQ